MPIHVRSIAWSLALVLITAILVSGRPSIVISVSSATQLRPAIAAPNQYATEQAIVDMLTAIADNIESLVRVYEALLAELIALGPRPEDDPAKGKSWDSKVNSLNDKLKALSQKIASSQKQMSEASNNLPAAMAKDMREAMRAAELAMERVRAEMSAAVRDLSNPPLLEENRAEVLKRLKTSSSLLKSVPARLPTGPLP